MALPIAALITAGLALLPKLPEMWGAVAGIFGKKVPEGVTQAGELAGEVLDSFSKGQLSPEAQIKLQEVISKHEERIIELSLEDRKITLEDKKIDYDLMKGAQQVEIEESKSPDEYVRRTRPLILRRLFYLMAIYIFFGPLLVTLCSYYQFDEATLNSVVGMLEYVSAFLFGTFSISFTGYMIGRTAEKKAGLQDGAISESLISSFTKMPAMFKKNK